jgi:hypothetical protein
LALLNAGDVQAADAILADLLREPPCPSGLEEHEIEALQP